MKKGKLQVTRGLAFFRLCWYFHQQATSNLLVKTLTNKIKILAIVNLPFQKEKYSAIMRYFSLKHPVPQYLQNQAPTIRARYFGENSNNGTNTH